MNETFQNPHSEMVPAAPRRLHKLNKGKEGCQQQIHKTWCGNGLWCVPQAQREDLS